MGIQRFSGRLRKNLYEKIVLIRNCLEWSNNGLSPSRIRRSPASEGLLVNQKYRAVRSPL